MSLASIKKASVTSYVWSWLCVVVFLTGCQSPAPEADLAALASGGQHPRAYLEDVESRVLTSAITGRDYTISVALPLGYGDSTKTYPVLYAQDANGQFGTVVETARMLRIGPKQIPQLIIVGIGYPYGGRQYNAGPHRIIDMFPTLDYEWIEMAKPNWPEPIPSYEAGGAYEFLRFLREELFPLIEEEYRADPSDRAIYGHSGGGYFGLFSLFERDGAFQRAIVGSPPLWWDDFHMFELEESYAQSNRAFPARVFFSVGLEEEDEGYEKYKMVTALRQLTEILERRQYEGLEWQQHYFEDENHQSVVAPTISRGLRYIYGGMD